MRCSPPSAEPKRTRIAEKDAAFHLAIADATHNVALAHVMHGLHELIRESMLTSHRLVDYDDEVEAKLLAQHRAIFDAIVARDPQRAREAAGAHLDYVQTLYRERPARHGARRFRMSKAAHRTTPTRVSDRLGYFSTDARPILKPSNQKTNGGTPNALSARLAAWRTGYRPRDPVFDFSLIARQDARHRERRRYNTTPFLFPEGIR